MDTIGDIEDCENGSRADTHACSTVSLNASEYKVLRALSEASEKLYGTAITKRTGITSGHLSRILEKLEENEWIVSEEEIGDERELRRSLRIYHCITPDGKARMLQKERDMEKEKVRLEKKLAKLSHLLMPHRRINELHQ